MEDETIFFDEDVKRHELLITSTIIAYKGVRLNTIAVTMISEAVFTQSVNGIPSASSFRITVASGDKTISIQCAKFGGMLRLGRSQYQRIKAALREAVGRRLIADALSRIFAGKALAFEQHGLLTGKRELTLSNRGVGFKQTGGISAKVLTIQWQHLHFTVSSGKCYIQCYSTGRKAAIQIWNMKNNMVLIGVLSILMDKANYRALEESGR